jgi:4-oxalocrotonate tautomerase family enzyme
MPVVQVHLLEGYSAADKQRLGTVLTDAIQFVVPAPPEAVTVMINEMPAVDYYRGGEQRTPAPALPDPTQTVHAFLKAMEERDLDTAETMLAEGFKMIFPGAAPMHKLSELVDWARPRYHFIKKTYTGFDAMPGGAGQIVYARGKLEGEWNDGTSFGGIRFIDRFDLKDGKILRQDVWNDLGEARP